MLTIRALAETTQATQTAVCDLLLQSLIGCKIIETVILEYGRDSPDHSAFPLSGPALSRFLTQRSDIPDIKLVSFELDEEHCRASVATENVKEDVNITLKHCHLTEAGERLLFDGIRRNLGPTSLQSCCFNTQLLADALRGNTRIKRFRCQCDHRLTDENVSFTDDNFLFLLRALAENLGIEKLVLKCINITDESWDAMCQSLANHPATLLIVLPMMKAVDPVVLVVPTC